MTYKKIIEEWFPQYPNLAGSLDELDIAVISLQNEDEKAACVKLIEISRKRNINRECMATHYKGYRLYVERDYATIEKRER